MSAPHIPLDPGALHVNDPIAHAHELNEIWEDGYATAEGDRRYRLLGLVLAGISGAIVGAVLTLAITTAVASAAPRSAQPAIPAVASTRDSVVVGPKPVHATSGNLAGPSGAPLASPPLPLSAAQGADSRSSGVPITEPDASMGGTATWCAPTPKHCQRWGGSAHLGAMESFRYGDRPFEVTVAFGERTTSVLVVSYCACPQTLIDLSPAAFAELAPLSRGRIPVTVTIPSGPGPTPPPTDTSP